MSWTALFVLAGGAYLFKAIGLLIAGPLTHRSNDGSADQMRTGGTQPGFLLRVGQLLPPALLAALVVSQTVVTGTELTVDGRLAGVTTGAVAVWLRAPFWLVLVIAAATTAGIRQI